MKTDDNGAMLHRIALFFVWVALLLSSCDLSHAPAAARPPTAVAPPAAVGNERAFPGFVVVYDTPHRRPLGARYALTREQAEHDPNYPRTGFHDAAGALPQREFPAGYDKGHLVPAENASRISREAFDACFTMLNCAPQDPTLNRGGWRTLESRVRALAREHGRVEVVVSLEYADAGVVPAWWSMRITWRDATGVARAKAWRVRWEE
jgi:DNA/RNA endonuclease G (NUC1)